MGIIRVTCLRGPPLDLLLATTECVFSLNSSCALMADVLGRRAAESNHGL